MFPLGSASREPYDFPTVTVALIVVNVVAFVLELLGGNAFIYQWSLVPANILARQDLHAILTSIFMHSGWVHILGNMIFLWSFGPVLEDLLGFIPFFLFYLLGGLAATFAHIVSDPGSQIPLLGASGAIAAVMGGFLVTFPKDEIRVLFLGYYSRVALVPAWLMVGVWILIQLLSGIAELNTTQIGGVAYMAHIGGFVFGMIFVRLFQTKARRRERDLE